MAKTEFEEVLLPPDLAKARQLSQPKKKDELINRVFPIVASRQRFQEFVSRHGACSRSEKGSLPLFELSEGGQSFLTRFALLV